VAELCGLRLSDLHFVASAAHLGCKAAGSHLHVVRREDNENGALAKSIYPPVMPVARDLVWAYNVYRAERDGCWPTFMVRMVASSWSRTVGAGGVAVGPRVVGGGV
jgi:hypothetical protein